MGGRGAFVDVSVGDFSFKEGGQSYKSIGTVDNVKVLVRTEGSVKAPEYSHTANRTYAIVQNGTLKHLTYYDSNHKQNVSIDFTHSHHGLQPHKHLNLDHSDKGIPPTDTELKTADRIRRRFGLK